MRIPSLMKINKHKRFNFEPRYYDAVKERIDEKIEQARREHDMDAEQAGYSSRISQAFQSRQRKNQNTGVASMVFILILAVIGGTYVMFGSAKLTIGKVTLVYGEFAPFLLGIVAIGYIFLRLKKNI